MHLFNKRWLILLRNDNINAQLFYQRCCSNKKGTKNGDPEDLPPSQSEQTFDTTTPKSVKMSLPPWRESSSLIIAARTAMHEVIGNNLSNVMGATKWNYSKEANKTCDYKILMVKRSGLSSFMANAFVFPGGLTDAADFSPRWRSVFETAAGMGSSSLDEFCHSAQKPRPPMIQDPVTLKQADQHHLDNFAATDNGRFLPSDIAFRITAIRETFEESGILLLTSGIIESQTSSQNTDVLALTQEDVGGIDLDAWRDRIHKDPFAFIELCLETKLCPNIWALKEWWNWLTPVSVGHRRYDTMFYLCNLNRTPRVDVDRQEVTTMKWSSPTAMLEANAAGALFLAPPQIYELSRLANHSSFTALQVFAARREALGSKRWMPIIAPADDGALSLLPGDELYPDQPDYYHHLSLEFSETLEEMRIKSSRLNRMEIRGPSCTVFCNLGEVCGHSPPLAYHAHTSHVQSFL